MYSPPQTPGTQTKKAHRHEFHRPETPPPSTHRLEIPVSPETPTPRFRKNDDPEETTSSSLFDDNHHQLSQPTTPVLYNLIRNEGPPKFVIAPTHTPETPTIVEEAKENSIESTIPYNRD
jgi:hypothetical protein